MTPNEKLFEVAKQAGTIFPQEYFFAETGTDTGTTALIFMKAIAETKKKRGLFTIDPYGHKPYYAGYDLLDMDYNDEKYRKTMAKLYEYANANEIFYTHWRMRSQDWVKVFPQIEFWHDQQKLENIEYALVYLDGEHHPNPVIQEFEYFYPRVPKGGVIIIDDYNLLGGERDTRNFLSRYEGRWEFDTFDDHWRAYLYK